MWPRYRRSIGPDQEQGGTGSVFRQQVLNGGGAEIQHLRKGVFGNRLGVRTVVHSLPLRAEVRSRHGQPGIDMAFRLFAQDADIVTHRQMDYPNAGSGFLGNAPQRHSTLQRGRSQQEPTGQHGTIRRETNGTFIRDTTAHSVHSPQGHEAHGNKGQPERVPGKAGIPRSVHGFPTKRPGLQQRVLRDHRQGSRDKGGLESAPGGGQTLQPPHRTTRGHGHDIG